MNIGQLCDNHDEVLDKLFIPGWMCINDLPDNLYAPLGISIHLLGTGWCKMQTYLDVMWPIQV